MTRCLEILPPWALQKKLYSACTRYLFCHPRFFLFHLFIMIMFILVWFIGGGFHMLELCRSMYNSLWNKFFRFIWMHFTLPFFLCVQFLNLHIPGVLDHKMFLRGNCSSGIKVLLYLFQVDMGLFRHARCSLVPFRWCARNWKMLRGSHQLAQSYLHLDHICYQKHLTACFSSSSLSTQGDLRMVVAAEAAKFIDCGDPKTRNMLSESFLVYEDFITKEEEDSLLAELEPYLRKLRYESSHWDDVSILWCKEQRWLVYKHR